MATTPDNLPEPLTPPDCDLRGMPYMPLDVLRLRESDMVAITNGEQFKAAFLLFAAAWNQVPAASLPNDDWVLARLAGYGLARWYKLRPMALRNWVRCSDGRLYHPVVAEKARAAWRARLRQRARAKKRWADDGGDDDAEPTDESRPLKRFPLDRAAAMQGRGRATGRGTERESVPEGTGAARVELSGANAAAWARAVEVLTRQGGLGECEARRMFGLLLARHGLEANELIEAISRVEAKGTSDPESYLAAAAGSVVEQKAARAAREPRPAWGVQEWRLAVELFRDEGRWLSVLGPPPGEAGCRVPADILAEFALGAARPSDDA
jgi:hypothetical protein